MEPRDLNEYVTSKSLLLRLKVDGPTREVDLHQFHQQYAPIIRGFAGNVGAKSQDVEDIVHDVMLGFFAAAPQFDYDPAKGRFRGYLKTCVWRTFQKRCRGQRLKFGRSLEEIDADELQVEAVWNDCWESEKLHRALAMVREDYLTCPPQPQRSKTFRAFEQVALLERSAEAVAQDMNISVESVYQAKSRVSKALQAAMERIDEATG
ncbi:MAG TPA: sigma-70 family RNA polymerase sigma factor [Tepidisphaeraceae bacterium]|jgi:RNA polymerase sigma-70 factor (ECF subfamily)|nr:sigma-70 family RNA polymerase sigma factor [Tepidisphaeraceae bacterium]